MVLERIQQDTPKTFWVVAAIGLQTHKYLVPPVSGNYFFHAALYSISGFLVSFSPVSDNSFSHSAILTQSSPPSPKSHYQAVCPPILRG